MNNQELKEKICELVNSPGYQFMNVEQLQELLNMPSVDDLNNLNQVTNQLVEDYQVALSNKNKLMPIKNAGLYSGRLIVNRKGFGFLDLDKEESIHLAQSRLKGAMNGDTVVVKRLPSFGENEGEVIKILQHHTNKVVGTFYVSELIQLKLDDSRIQSEIKVINLDDFRFVTGTKAQFKIVSYGNPLVLEIIQLLGHIDDPGVDILSVLLEYDIDPVFPPDVLSQVEKTPDKVSACEKAGRTDLTKKQVITIDGADSKDLDDAISIEKTTRGYRLGVHIADVSHYVQEGTPLDIEACKRGTSTYVVDRVVPMLPHILSNGICSLNPKVIRLTLSCEMEINQKGEIEDYKIFPSFIKTTERMTYTDVNAMLEKDELIAKKYKAIGEMVENFQACSKLIRARRHTDGAIDFEKDEAKILLDEHNQIYDIVLRERKEAEAMIEDFMVCANECVARHCKWLEIPALYRVHESPSAEKLRDFAKMMKLMGRRFKGSTDQIRPSQLQQLLESFKEEPEYPVISTMMLRSMQKARYDANCLGHFGLALEEYTHFTSPIRRYPDLIVHRMLHKYCFESNLDSNAMKQDEIKMENIAMIASERERAATDAEREVEDMKKAEFMEQQVGKVVEGVISGVTKFGLFVELPNTVEGLVHVKTMNDDYYAYDASSLALVGELSRKAYKLGQKVKVKVTSASKEDQEINFSLIRERKDEKRVYSHSGPRVPSQQRESKQPSGSKTFKSSSSGRKTKDKSSWSHSPKPASHKKRKK